MTISPVSYSVIASPQTTTYTIPLNHQANESPTNAVNIGDLEQQGVILQLSDQGTSDGSQTYNFTLQQGDDALLQLSFGNPVDQVTTHVQILDSQGNVVADNQGTTAQQYAYTQITTSGFSPGAGNYSAVVTPVGGTGSPQLSLSALQQQGTSLAVNSTLTAADPAEYYNFSFGNGSNLKLAFDAGTGTSATRVQIFNSTGHLIADSNGNAFQQNEYVQLTSGTGLSASPGNYTVAVSYNNPSSTSADQKYNFQLYSGTNYGIVYQSNVAAIPADNSAAGSVTATPDAQAFGQQAYNKVNATAQTAVPVGWLSENKTAINTTSILTPVDATDFYTFVLQKGDNLKLALTNLTNKSDTTSVRLQLLDSSGGRVIADNQGTAVQQAAFKELTSSTGLAATPAAYVIKATYGSSASKTSSQEYNFQVFSGTSYSSVYNTSASAQNYENAVLSGDIAGGYSPFAAAASYLNSVANGATPDITTALSKLA